MLSRRLLRIKAIQSIYAVIERGEIGQPPLNCINEFNKSADQCYQLYLEFLNLLLYIQKFAQNRIDIGRSKLQPTEADLNPNIRFVENPLFSFIEEALKPYSSKFQINWDDNREILSELYNEMISEEYYKLYMNNSKCSLTSHKNVLMKFLELTLVNNENIEKTVEEKSIFWTDDIDYAASFVATTIKEVPSRDGKLQLAEKYVDDDVKEFGKELIRNSLKDYTDNFKIITKNCLNWEAERIALLDRVILITAISEIKTFPTIPLNVTMDEYIEISKYYSSEDSSGFINGVLNKVVKEMQSTGSIHKTGRGLV